MGFFTSIKKAVKAGTDFNPELQTTINALEELEAQGKLDSLIAKATDEFEKEHNEYLAKGIRTDAADSARDSAALKHFLNALSDNVNALPPEVKPHALKLLELREDMQKALGPIGKAFF